MHTFLYNKWYFDEAIDILIVRPALAIGRFANNVFERFVIDGGDHRRHRGDGRQGRRDRPRLPERHRPHLRPLPDLRRRRPRPLLPHPTVMINALLWVPLAFGVVGLFLPKRLVGWWATAGAVATLVIAVIMAFGFDNGAAGLQDTVNTTWISGLGVNYSLGIDGLNLFLVLLTAVLWIGGIAFAAFREQERPQLFFFLMLAAETATLGSFLSQDLLLFVLFFDLMLVPFYFLFGAWGVDRTRRRRADGAAGDAEDDDLHADRLAADAGRRDRHGDHLRPRRPPHLLDPGDPANRACRSAASAGSSGSSPPPSWSRCPPSSSTAGCPTPTGRRRCRCWSSSPGCWRRSAPTGSCGWCCRSSRRRRRSSRR